VFEEHQKMFKTDLQLREQSWIFTKFPFNVTLWGVTTKIGGEGINICKVKGFNVLSNSMF
jgi:hypothetical protein